MAVFIIKMEEYLPEPADTRPIQQKSSYRLRKTTALEDACIKLINQPVDRVSDLLQEDEFRTVACSSHYQKLDKIFSGNKNHLKVIRNPENLVKRAVLNGLGTSLLLSNWPDGPKGRLLEPLVYEISKAYSNISVFVYETPDQIRIEENIREMFFDYVRSRGIKVRPGSVKKQRLFQALCYLMLSDALEHGQRRSDRKIARILKPYFTDMRKFVFETDDMEKMPSELHERFAKFME